MHISKKNLLSGFREKIFEISANQNILLAMAAILNFLSAPKTQIL